uniref:Ig-like domain-containing protein n=1 Tax=Poecilia formosa TaxID=48698 RepID=A0A087YRV3_POEFO
MYSLVLLCSYTGFSLDIHVHQFPPALLGREGQSVQLVCSHEHGDLRVMLWYRRRSAEVALELVGYGYVEFKDDSVEEAFRQKGFSLAGDLSGNNAKNGSLFIRSLKAAEHEATYFCAARSSAEISRSLSSNMKL